MVEGEGEVNIGVFLKKQTVEAQETGRESGTLP